VSMTDGSSAGLSPSELHFSACWQTVRQGSEVRGNPDLEAH
jgi:hypothetical protein